MKERNEMHHAQRVPLYEFRLYSFTVPHTSSGLKIPDPESRTSGVTLITLHVTQRTQYSALQTKCVI